MRLQTDDKPTEQPNLASPKLPRPGGRAALAAVIFVAALVVAGPRVLPGRTPIPLDMVGLYEPWLGVLPAPVNPILGDPVQQLTSAAYSTEALQARRLPLWNPHVLGGHPLAGDSIAAPFNPIQMVLRAVLPLHAALRAQILVQLLLAGAAMAWWVSTATSSRRAAAVAAVAWVMAGYQQVWLAYVYHLASLVWIPVAVVCWEKSARSRGWAWAGAGGVAAGLAAHGGQVQIGLYAAVLAGAYAVLAMLVLGVPRRAGLASGLLIASIGVLVAAPTLLPALEQTAESARVAYTAEALRATALPISHLATAVAPWLFGDPVRRDYAGQSNTNELMIYAGIVPLLLAVAAPIARRDRLGWVAAAMLGLVALLTLGWMGTGVQGALPVVRYFGVARWVAVWPMAVSFAAGVAIAGAEASVIAARRLRAVAAGFALLLALGAVAAGRWVLDTGARTTLAGTLREASTLWPGDLPWGDLAVPLLVVAVAAVAIGWWCGSPRSKIRLAMLIAVIALDLGTFAARYSPAGRLEMAYPPLPPLAELAGAAAKEGVRVAPLSGDRIVLAPGVAPMVGLDTVDGYSSALQGGYARFVAALSEPSGNGNLDSNRNLVALGRISPVLARLLNVGYVLTAEELAPRSRLTWAGDAGAARTGGSAPVFCDLDPGLDAVAGAWGTWRALVTGEEVSGKFSPDADGLHRLDVTWRAGHQPQDNDPGRGDIGAGTRAGVRGRLTISAPDGTEIVNEGMELEPGNPDSTDADHGVVHTVYFARQSSSLRVPYTATLRAESPVEVCVDAAGALAVSAYASEDALPLAFEAGDLKAYRLPNGLGAAWEVTADRVVETQGEALALVAEPGFDPAELIVVEATAQHPDDAARPGRAQDEAALPDHTPDESAPPGRTPDESAPPGRTPDESAPPGRTPDEAARPGEPADEATTHLDVESTLPGDLTVHLGPAAGGWVAIAQAYAPGWRATVDGAPAPVVRAYGGIPAVPVPPGASELHLWYAPRSVTLGLALSLVGLTAAVALVLPALTRRLRRSRVRRADTPA